MVVARFYALLPRDYSHTIREQLNEIDVTLSGFIRGQTNICLLMACYYGILLSLVGINFGLLIGVLSGLVLFIPFVGFLSSFIFTVIVTMLQFPDGGRLIAVLVIFGIGAVLENSVLTPRLVGRNVGLHPLWIIFGMLSGAALFGFVGILISVPVTAVIGVLARFAITRYLHSSAVSRRAAYGAFLTHGPADVRVAHGNSATPQRISFLRRPTGRRRSSWRNGPAPGNRT